MTYVSGKKISLRAKLNVSDTSLTADVDVGITAGRLYFKNDLQEEWIDFTGVSASGSNYSYTGLTRGLSQTADPSTAGTGKTWGSGTTAVIVAMHDQLFSKQENQTLPKSIAFSGTTNSGIRANNLTTAQRTALTGANGMIVYDTTLGELYQYIAGSWSAVSSGSTQPNSSTTVAGKVEMTTQDEVDAGTDTGGTGAQTCPSPSMIAEAVQQQTWNYNTTAGSANTYTLDLTPDIDDYVTGLRVSVKINATNTGASTLNVDGKGAKNILRIDGNSVEANDLVSGKVYEMVYDGTQFQLTSSVPSETVDTVQKFGGTGADGAISGSLTITGSDNTYIVKNYTSFVPGANTVTITPVGCILHIKVKGNCDLTGTTFSFSGKGGAGGALGASGNNPGTTASTLSILDLSIGGGVRGMGYGTGSGHGTGGVSSPKVVGGSTWTFSQRRLYVAPGAGGGGGGGGNGANGGAGGEGGGAMILEVAGDLTLSSTTATFTGVAGSNGVTGGTTSGGAGGGGGGGVCIILYNGTLTGSLTPTVSGGAGGTGGAATAGPAYGGQGAGGGASIVANGTDGSDQVGNDGSGGAGGAGANGYYMIEKNTVFL